MFRGPTSTICGARCTLIESFIAEKIVGTTLSVTGDRAERATGSVVSANYFDALGVHPILGRGFEPVEETGRNAHPVVVISYQTLEGSLPRPARHCGRDADAERRPSHDRGRGAAGLLRHVCRLQVPVLGPGVDAGDLRSRRLQARRPRRSLDRRLREAQAWRNGAAGAGRDLRGRQAARSRVSRDKSWTRHPAVAGVADRHSIRWRRCLPTLGIALAVVTSVLLIACANVGNLLLLKSFARRREMTIRLAVGAGRRRLVQQLLTEGLILSAFAAAGGLVVAYWCRNALVLLFPPRGGTVLRLPGGARLAGARAERRRLVGRDAALRARARAAHEQDRSGRTR